eukprot:7238967-Prymnesium_polylepis.1
MSHALTDQGIALLKEQQRLRRLDLTGCAAVSPAAVLALKEALSDCAFGPCPPPAVPTARAEWRVGAWGEGAWGPTARAAGAERYGGASGEGGTARGGGGA